jgi:peptidoglycan/LPS O-acetylase OafA/YrhL
MQYVIPAAVLIGLCVMVLRVIWVCGELIWRLMGRLTPRGAVIAAICGAAAMYWLAERPARQEGSAADYRRAADAVSRASGRPCEYECKQFIADQARPRPELAVD